MWPPWIKTPRGSPRPTLDRSFSNLSTFKDVGALIQDDNNKDDPSSARPKPSIFHRVRIGVAALRALRSFTPKSQSQNSQIVIYFTSLRIIRKTFEDCRTVLAILRGFRVALDERDVSMESSFLKDLGGRLDLPQVFIGGRHVGGADQIRQLHETGELARILEGAPAAPQAPCAGCGGDRFVLCNSCSGSHKCFSEKGGGFQSCLACNENGLVRCPDCFAG